MPMGFAVPLPQPRSRMEPAEFGGVRLGVAQDLFGKPRRSQIIQEGLLELRVGNRNRLFGM
jgi:hypothetical protein